MMLALGVFLMLPLVAFAGQQYTNPTSVFANAPQDNRWNRVDDQRDRDDRRRDGDNRGYRRRGRNWDGYGNYGGSFQLRQTALNAGFNEGTKEGRKDRSHNDRFDFQDEGAYQKATKDYSSRLGDREIYRRYFREAFENGYNDGYNGY